MKLRIARKVWRLVEFNWFSGQIVARHRGSTVRAALKRLKMGHLWRRK